jgi:hypothetical protein
MIPLLLLDVDGVLNALGEHHELANTWPSWQNGFARSAMTSWPIQFSPDLIERLVRWHLTGIVEIQWLTTWGHNANGGLRQLLGFPALEVAGTYDDEGAAAEVGDSLASSTPSAPDALTGAWWKYDVVRRVMVEHPHRLIVWVDDELHATSSPFRAWAADQPHLIAIGPHPMTGLSPPTWT